VTLVVAVTMEVVILVVEEILEVVVISAVVEIGKLKI
jgi:hypothetical protein